MWERHWLFVTFQTQHPPGLFRRMLDLTLTGDDLVALVVDRGVRNAARTVDKWERHPNKKHHEFLERETPLATKEILTLAEHFDCLLGLARGAETCTQLLPPEAQMRGAPTLAFQAHMMTLSGPWNWEFVHDDLEHIVEACGDMPLEQPILEGVGTHAFDWWGTPNTRAYDPHRELRACALRVLAMLRRGDTPEASKRKWRAQLADVSSGQYVPSAPSDEAPHAVEDAVQLEAVEVVPWLINGAEGAFGEGDDDDDFGAFALDDGDGRG